MVNGRAMRMPRCTTSPGKRYAGKGSRGGPLLPAPCGTRHAGLPLPFSRRWGLDWGAGSDTSRPASHARQTEPADQSSTAGRTDQGMRREAGARAVRQSRRRSPSCTSTSGAGPKIPPSPLGGQRFRAARRRTASSGAVPWPHRSVFPARAVPRSACGRGPSRPGC